MYFLILTIGLLLLIYNLCRWRRFRLVFSQAQLSGVEHSSLRLPCKKVFTEWYGYALKGKQGHERLGLIISIVMFAIALAINSVWLHIRCWWFFPVLIWVLFMGQLHLGRRVHRKNFENNFPEVLSIVNAVVSTGNSVQQALQRCGNAIPGPLGATFDRIDRRLNLGEEPDRVFSDARQEFRFPEFHFFSIVILVSMDRGGQLKGLIGQISRIINNNKKISRRKIALTSEARTSAKIIASLPLLYLIGMKYFKPDDLEFILSDPIGRYVLYYTLGSIALGNLVNWCLLKRAT
ncbi:Flp pilus assembly protein B (plasmid) [Sodalis praecaptivus]|uniref:Flp pilus assembly protein B n=1 Tax=Sodalis praecaptivus TaxID=1239307 RepID=W0I3W1_9GAMM|nr:type II secretion system F family protein [Sodalis praecaptivus]AHF79108.1 Flp pilus assembly protein B [Sodalis praecaptivus]